MALSINEFYQYVFGTFSQIEINAQTPENKRKELLAKKKTAIQNKFTSITENTALSLRFRGLLRELNNQDLEDLLYGDHTAEVEPTPFPKDEIILEHFESLDQQYAYFIQDKTAKDRFITFFKACKLMADFDEMNNTEHDSLAYEHAYKILVLTGSKNILDVEKFLEKYSDRFKDGKPIHDMFVRAIPKNAPPIHLADWQKLIRAAGFKAITLFQRAPDIEKALDHNGPHAPKTISEAEVAASSLSYKRAKENLELATLCERYNVDELSFNKCLDIKPKTADQLPDVSIDGSLVGHPGYHLVKLPVNDPRAFILGHITNCCQSIGGHSEQCVIDGITRAHNGFYVLLEGRPNDNAPPLINGTINYEHYALVGQGYAWLSQKDNLTFDSWENLTPSVGDKIIVPMLQQFGEQVTQQEHSRILRVTIGTGGKTPDSYSNTLPLSEAMAEGYAYGDATKQALVYLNQSKINTFQSDLQQRHGKNWSVGEITSIQQLEQLEHFFLDGKNIQNYKNALGVQYENFLMHCLKSASFLLIAYVLDKQQLLNNKRCYILINEEKHVEDLADILSAMYNTNPSLINDENFTLLINQTQHAKSISKALNILYKTNPSLINDEMVKFLIHRAQNVTYLADALKALYRADPSLVNDANLDLLDKDTLTTIGLAEALAILYKANPTLVNDENRTILNRHAENADEIAQALNKLYTTNQSLVSEKNFKFLTSQAQNATKIAHAFSELHKANPSLLSDENCGLLVKNANSAISIAGLLIQLHKANPELVNDANRFLLDKHVQNIWEISQALSYLPIGSSLLNDENFKLLANQAQNARKIAQALSKLYIKNPSLLNDENRTLLDRHAEEAVEFAEALSTLYTANPSLVNDQNRALLDKHSEDALGLAEALSTLYAANPSLVDDENRALLAKHPEDAGDLAEALSILYTTNPYLVNNENRTLLSRHAEDAEEFAEALSTLYTTHPSLMNEENRILLSKHAEDVEDLAYILSELYKVHPSLVNNENRALLDKHVENAEAIAYSLSILHKVNPSLVNDENRALLDRYADDAEEIAKALKILYNTAPSLINNQNYKLLVNRASDALDIASDLIHEHQTPKGLPQEKGYIKSHDISSVEKQQRIKESLQEEKKAVGLSENKTTAPKGG